MVSHPSRKNKDAVRVGHPQRIEQIEVAVQIGQANKRIFNGKLTKENSWIGINHKSSSPI
jgi:hypothetical protein